MIVDIDRFRELSRRAQAGVAAAVLGLTAAVPLLVTNHAYAATTLAKRKLESTSAVPNSNTQLTWTFDVPANAGSINADYIEIQFCDTPLTACTTSNTPTIDSSLTAAVLSGFTTDTVATTTRENGLGGGAGNTNNQIQIDKTNADVVDGLTGLSITIDASDVTNNASPNKSYYTRMRIYSDAGTTLQYEGVFAQSTSQTLTVNARVQERLDFCVGATTVNDATTTPGDCTAITTASGTVDVGNVESGTVNVSPVDAVNGGSDTNGVALVRTNAVNGASVAYRAIADNSSGALKVPTATCDDNNGGTAGPDVFSAVATDQCFNTNGTMGIFTANTERFGMAVAGINCDSGNAYSCNMATDVYNLRRQANYDGNESATTFISDSNQVTPTTSEYAWDADPANTTTIASSTGATPTGFKVIDNEALILKFAATAGVTTPTGAYSVQADFIATTTF
jgi:hypothetical protein